MEGLPAKFSDRFVVMGSGCWEWTAGKISSGYGSFRTKNKHWLAHRFSYSTLVGPIPDGLVIDHLCRVRACVNPSHMEVVTNRENILRGEGPSAKQARQTHCIHGHELTDENTWIRKNGARQCGECNARRQRETRARRNRNAKSNS